MQQDPVSPAAGHRGGGGFFPAQMFLRSRQPLLTVLLLVVMLLPALRTASPGQQLPGIPATPTPAAPGEEEPRQPRLFPDVPLDTPREAMRVFLESMRAEREGNWGRWRFAAATLSLDHLPTVGREAAARRIASELYAIINRLEFVNIEELPGEEYTEQEWVYWELEAANITLVRQEDGNWRFSRDTTEAIPEMFAEVRDRPLVEGAPVLRFVDSPTAWFRTHLPQWLFTRTFILENFQWLGMLLVILAGTVLDRVVRFVIEYILRSRFRESDYEYNSEYLRALAKWTGIAFGGIVWIIGLSWLGLPELLHIILHIAAVLVATVAGVLAMIKVVDLGCFVLEQRVAKTRTKLDDLLVPLLRKTLKVFVTVFGIVIVADNLEVNITGVIAGLGLGGLAFALAAKDTVENLFGSITILLDRPFHIGDWVGIGDVEGTVETIGFRSTRVRTFYDSLVTIPNSNLIKANVDNYGARRRRRVRCFLSITYDTPPEKVEAFCEGIREIIRNHPYTLKTNYHAWFNEFGSHSLSILLWAFHETPDWATELRERHRLFLDIMRLAKRLGVEFAFPTQKLYLERGRGPAESDSTPFQPWRDVARYTSDTRGQVRELVDIVHKSGGAPFPPPPVTFNIPVDFDSNVPLAPRNQGGSSGGEDGGSGEAGSR